MNYKFKRKKIVMVMAIIYISILGISYASWTKLNNIFMSVTTSTLDYDFLSDSNGLWLVRNGMEQPLSADITMERKNLLINNLNGAAIINLNYQDILRIHYKVKENDETSSNVALKSIDMDLGEISINLDYSTYYCDYVGTSLSPGEIAGFLPSTLGTFRVHHTFDGVNGTIDLVPVHLASAPPAAIKVSIKDNVREVKTVLATDLNTDLSNKTDTITDSDLIEISDETTEDQTYNDKKDKNKDDGQEESQEINQESNEEKNSEMDQEKSLETKEEANQDTDQELNQDINQDIDQELNQDIVRDTDQETSQDESNDSDKTTNQDTNKDVDKENKNNGNKDKSKKDNKDLDKSKPKTKEVIETTTEMITLRGQYYFSIPINFDQYNAG